MLASRVAVISLYRDRGASARYFISDNDQESCRV